MSGELGDKGSTLPGREEISTALDNFLRLAVKEGKTIDTITFAGNGEPTLHPDFAAIIDDTIRLRQMHLPAVKIAVLSNATLIGKTEIHEALLKIDHNILKLDSAIEASVLTINCPQTGFSMRKLIDDLSKFQKGLTIQTLFVKGSYKGNDFDNTSRTELKAWLEALERIRPELVMIYTIARDTPIRTIEKIGIDVLEQIALRVRSLGLNVVVSD
jgi:wyosine [tRNA(Phe)-imidazoG37] synthetase (radical SAM superfamily)